VDVSILIVNWNSRRFLKACIESIERHTQGLDYEIIVVDSGSFDGCGEMLQRAFPAVRFIQSAHNLGFAKANNLAQRAARGRCLLFLNPDTELVSPAVNLMHAQLLRSPDAGAVGCKLLNADGSLQTSCVQPFPTLLNQLLNAEALRRRFPAARLWGMAPLLDVQAAPAKVEVVSGACVMLRRSTFEQVGGFSEDYFMYAEDLDLCHKLAQAGYSNYCLPAARVRHFGGGSSDSAPSDFSVVMMRESIWRFLRKRRGAWYGSAYRVSTLLAALPRLAVLLVAGASPRRRAALRKWLAVLAWSVGLRHGARPS
jgi:N-acetylglucosaminyl-diphospho-decaprenol L-rhamnosyltransferase